jgi:acetate---CoA ligase (ADP-forming)
VTCADNDYMTSLRRELPRIAWLRDLNKTLRVASRLAPVGDPPLATSHLHASDGLRQSLMRMAGTHQEPFALNEQVSKKILGEFGIRTPREAFVERMDVEEAARAGRDIGFPVVLKVVSAAVTHKSDVGLVLLNLSSEADLRQAVQLLSERCDALGVSAEGLLVVQQITGGVEVIIGLHRDPEMGPVVMFGSGGIFLELFRDVAFGPPGLDEARARNMILSTRVADLIKGYRGSEPSDVEALVGALKAMGALAIELGDFLESAEINPLIVRADGVYALDALLVVAGDKLRSSGPTLDSSG